MIKLDSQGRLQVFSDLLVNMSNPNAREFFIHFEEAGNKFIFSPEFQKDLILLGSAKMDKKHRILIPSRIVRLLKEYGTNPSEKFVLFLDQKQNLCLKRLP